MISRYNICLTFGEKESKVFIKASQELAELFESSYVLGGKSLPHISLAQFEASVEEAKSFYQLISEKKKALRVSFGGMSFNTYGMGSLWIDINVLKSESLAKLHNEVVGVIGEKRVFGGFGDYYRPHVTLALREKCETIPCLELDGNTINIKNMDSHVSLGISGPNGIVTELLKV